MSIRQNLLSAFRVMNFISSERAWQALSAEADFKVSEKLPKGNILVIAPHPDDEVFGCAGALKSVDKEQKVWIAYIFSGDERSASEKASNREAESKEAVRLLTDPEQIFFRLPDNCTVGKNVISPLSELVNEADIIFLPSFSDPNIDHRETVSATIEALKMAKIKEVNLSKIKIWLYEIWNPLPYFNRLVEIDWDEKKKAMEKFISQKSERNYIKAIKSLNEYRGEMYGLKKPAEAFFALPADLLVKIFKEGK